MTENFDTYPKCPHCHCDIEYGDLLGYDYDDTYYFANWDAFCPQCQRTYTFVEDFKLVDRRFLDERQDS